MGRNARMICSMTGFGRCRATVDGLDITVEIKSVNSRFFDCNAKISRAYSYLEERVKPYLQGKGISRELGTRHRAAIGVSETTDAVVLIVSEETGIISMAKGGKLTRHLDSKSLKEILGSMYEQNHPNLLAGLFHRKGKEGA